MSNTALNRTSVALLTNKSGGSVAQGDVVIVDSANAASFTTTTTSAYISGSVGVVLEPNGIASNAVGAVAFGGYVPLVNLSGSASLGDVFHTHTVAKQAVRHAAPVVGGDFGQVLGTGTTPAAFLWSQPSSGPGAGDASFTSATLLNSWASFGAPYATPGYIKDAAGIVHLRGLVKNGSSAGATVFTLPSGYRPSAQVLIPVSANSAYQAVIIDTSGNVAFANSFTTSTYGSLDGVSFSTL